MKITLAAAALLVLSVAACSPYYGGYGPPPENQRAAQEQPAPPPNAPAPPPGAPSVSGRAMVPNLICDDDQKMAHSHIVVYGAVVAKSDCKLVLSNCEVRGGLYAERDARVVLSNCIVHGTVRVVRDAKLIADSATRFTGHVSTESGGKVTRRSAGSPCQGPIGPLLGASTVVQSGRNRNLPSGQAKPSMKWALSNAG